MQKIRIGCAGFAYQDWKGPFYPKSTKSNNFLGFYSKYFDIVEVNSTFYNLLPKDTLTNWLMTTPSDFRFSIKIWQKISHKRKNVDLPEVVGEFFSRMWHLEPKIDYYLLQFPPWLKYSEKQYNFVSNLLDLIRKNTKKTISIEFRDNSWFSSDVLDSLIKDNFIIGTAYLQDLTPYYYENQKYIYIRAIGDRKLTTFNRIQRNMQNMSEHLLDSVKKYKDMNSISDIFIIYNNHFSGFSPQDSINLKKKLGLKFKDFNKQQSLMDFV